MWGYHSIKSWCTTQTVVALSSGEAELYALTKGAAQTLGLTALAKDLGCEARGTLHSDANAALGIVAREGLGKLRHVRVQYLWIQDRVRGGDLQTVKVCGPNNPADLLTKHLPAQDIVRHSEAIGVTLHSDRADMAPELAGTSTVSVDNAPEDQWVENTEEVERQHKRPRTRLFTPLRVQGAPTAAALTATRITMGTYCGTDESFRIVDNWSCRGTAHRDLGRPWTGTTRFLPRTPL